MAGLQNEQTERRRYEEQLALTVAISRDLLSASSSTMLAAMCKALGDVALHLGADAATLARRERDGRFRRLVSWFEPDVGPFPGDPPEFVSLELVPWIRALVDDGRSELIRDIDDLPADADGERWMLRNIGAHSAAIVGIRGGEVTAGYVSFYWRTGKVGEDVEVLSPLSIIGDLLVAADARANAEAARSTVDARLAAIVDSTLDAIVSTTLGGTIVSWNPGAEHLFGYSAAEAIGQSFLINMPPDCSPEVALAMRKAVRGEVTTDLESVRVHKDGRRLDVVSTLSAIRDGSGKIVAVAGITRDITERKRAERESREAAARFRALIEHASDGIVVSDKEGWFTFVSPAAGRILGHEPSKLMKMNWVDLIHPDFLERAMEIRAELRTGTDDVVRFEVEVHHADGRWIWLELQMANLSDEEAIQGTVFNFRDVSEQKTFEEQLAHNALHDPLTRLANRLLLTDRVEHANNRAERANTSVGLLFLDLDHFKDINDSQGHGAGDEVLVQIAARLLDVVRPSDTVARFGGDEFVILVEDLTSMAQLLALADRVRIALSSPVSLSDGREAHTTASIGIVESVRGTAKPETLLRDADAAMYRAKAQGRDRYEVFDASIYAEVIAHLETADRLRDAIANDELRLHYQPIMDTGSRRLIGFEALVRWQRAPDDLVAPGDFIAIAEDTGLIVPIGAWVLEEACRQASTWIGDGDEPAPSININLSIRQLRDPALTATLRRVIAATGIEPGRVTLEITESMLAENTTAALAMLSALKQVGVKLSVDDFGTGYSSLAYLKQFPVDVLKIDQSFVADLGKDHQDTAIVNAIITLAHGLGLTVTAEGVETQEQLDELQRQHCDHVQGYFLGRPAPIEEWTHLVHQRETAPAGV